MHRFRTILIIGVLALTSCSAKRDSAIFHPWGWESVEDAKSDLAGYKHVLVARVDGCSWEDRGPNRLTPYHFKATVIRSYKGDWSVSERISFVHYVDAPSPATSNTNLPGGYSVVIFSNEHTNGEIALETGEWRRFSEELAPALEVIYPEKGKP